MMIADAIRRYDELLIGHYLDDTREHLARAIEREPLVAECKVLRPYFVAARVYEETRAVTALLGRAIVAAADRLVADKRLRAAIGIPDYFDEVLELDRVHGRASVMARFDGMLAADGVFKIIEYNSQPEFSPARAIDDMFATSRIAAHFGREVGFRTQRLDEYAVDGLGADRADPRSPAAIAVPGGDDRGRYWLRHAQARGHRVTFAPYDRFHLDGARLVVEDGEPWPIDYVVLQWEDALCPTDDMEPVLAAVRSGAVRVLDGFSRGLLCGYKHTLELLSDPVHATMFDAPVAAALALHVPWTRGVRERTTTYGGESIDLVPFILRNRERLVLKPSGGSQGQGVVIGPQADDATWTQAVTRALKHQYIAQEWIPGEVGEYPAAIGDATRLTATTDFNPFVWGGRDVRGCQVRLATSGKHSADDGAIVTAVWVIE